MTNNIGDLTNIINKNCLNLFSTNINYNLKMIEMI